MTSDTEEFKRWDVLSNRMFKVKAYVRDRDNKKYYLPLIDNYSIGLLPRKIKKRFKLDRKERYLLTGKIFGSKY